MTDPHEIMTMVARTRTAAVGAHPSVDGSLNPAAAVNLQTTFGFGDTREEHSAQFTRRIQTAKVYYDVIFDLVDAP